MSFEHYLQWIETKIGGCVHYKSSNHGISHLREVALLAGRIAAESGADVETAMIAAFLHDIGRGDDSGGNQHAIRRAISFRDIASSLL